jgi:hypothetical protein
MQEEGPRTLARSGWGCHSRLMQIDAVMLLIAGP